MKLTKALAAALAGLSIFALAACSTEKEEKDQLVFGTSADFAPFEFHIMKDGKDTIVGADVELAKKIAEDMGKELVIKDVSFDVLLNELKTGNIDMVAASMAVTEERMEEADPSSVYNANESHLAVIRKEDADTLKSFDDFEGKKVAVQVGSIQVGMAEEHMTGCELLLLQSVPDMMNNLINGKVDAVVITGDVAEGYMASNDELTTVDDEFPKINGTAVWVQKGDPQGLLESINKTIEEVIAEGLYDQWLEEAEALSE